MPDACVRLELISAGNFVQRRSNTDNESRIPAERSYAAIPES
jgi:hypothetical protein